MRIKQTFEASLSFLLFVFSDGCCNRIDWYKRGEKEQGSFIIQAEKVNGNCYYVLEGGTYLKPRGLWICGDSWWYGQLSDKGQCKGIYNASINSKSNIHGHVDSLQWVYFKGYPPNEDIWFSCIDVSL